MNAIARISYDEYEAMIERGDFDVDDPRRYELIEGEILPMVAPNPPHEESVDLVNVWSFQNLPLDAVRVRVQQSVGLPALNSLPLPDLTWVRNQSYRKKRPQSEDVFLIVEVAYSSLYRDRNRKGRLYARAGLREYWIVNLRSDCIEVYRDPGPTGYASRTMVFAGEDIHPLSFPDLAFPVSLIFPEPESEVDHEENEDEA